MEDDGIFTEVVITALPKIVESLESNDEKTALCFMSYYMISMSYYLIRY